MNPSSASSSKVPASIWVLGFVSMLMDISSEMIHSLLPLFLVGSLGASALMVGLIDGAAEATALIVKVFSGGLSDYWGTRPCHRRGAGRPSARSDRQGHSGRAP